MRKYSPAEAAYLEHERYIRAEQLRQYKEYEKQRKQAEQEEARKYRYPKLSNKVVQASIAYDIAQHLAQLGVRTPSIEVLMTKLKFKRICSDTPVKYKIRNNYAYLIKHACYSSGVKYNAITTIPVVYHSDFGDRYNHDYMLKVPYYFCQNCLTVIYYFNGIEVSEYE